MSEKEPKQFPVPEKVQPGRPVNSLLGLGGHKRRAGSFIDQVGDVITFRLLGLK
jgi:hypothetical protein